MRGKDWWKHHWWSTLWRSQVCERKTHAPYFIFLFSLFIWIFLYMIFENINMYVSRFVLKYLEIGSERNQKQDIVLLLIKFSSYLIHLEYKYYLDSIRFSIHFTPNILLICSVMLQAVMYSKRCLTLFLMWVKKNLPSMK